MKPTLTVFLLWVLTAASVYAGPPNAVVFNGSTVRTLQPGISLAGKSQVLSGTVDPSSVATAGTIGSLYLNNSSGTLYRKTDNGTSTNWTNSLGAATAPNSSIICDTPQGHGSTNTKLRYYQTCTLTGTDLTVTSNDSTNGFIATVNTAGSYSVSAMDATSVGCTAGITVNDSAKTTSIFNLTRAQGFLVDVDIASNKEAAFSWTQRFSVNDTISIHDDGGCDRTYGRIGVRIERLN